MIIFTARSAMGNVRFHGFLPKNGKYSYKWQPWVDHDIFYDMVKFAFRCFYMGKCLSIRVHATCKLYMVHYSYEKWVYEQFLSRGKSQLSPFNHYLSYFDIYKLSDSFDWGPHGPLVCLDSRKVPIYCGWQGEFFSRRLAPISDFEPVTFCTILESV